LAIEETRFLGWGVFARFCLKPLAGTKEIYQLAPTANRLFTERVYKVIFKREKRP
jgi:hypothetical protein